MKMGKWAAMHDAGEEKVMEELSKGRELAMQLRRLLMLNMDHDEPIMGGGAGEDDDNLVGHLAGKILDSFWNSLSILNNYSDHHHHHHYHQISHRIIVNSHSGISDHDQTTATTTTTTTTTAAAARRRPGSCSYKRRKKCSDSEDIRKTEHSTIEYDDGHAWRKYGQKIIHNTKFPRSYYRCTHKYDQGCGAKKQMEMIQQNPAKYVSTYYGDHTCTSPQKHVQFLLESTEYYIFNSNSTNSSGGSGSGSGSNNNNNNVKMLSFGSTGHDPSCSPSTTFQLPAHMSCTPMVFSSTSTSTLQLEEEEDHQDLMKISKLCCNGSSVKDDEQAGAVLTQLHPAAHADDWCLSPQFLLPIGSSDDDDDASNDSVDFTHLQHCFTFP